MRQALYHGTKASQVFLCKDHVSEYWHVALKGKKKIDINEENMINFHIVDIHPFKTTINFDEDSLVDDIHEIWEYHNNGIYIWSIHNFMYEFRIPA